MHLSITMKGFLTDRSVFLQFLVLIALCFTSVSIGSILGLALFPLMGVDLLEGVQSLGNLSDPKIIGALKLMQILQAIFLFIIPAWIFPYFLDERPKDFLKADHLAPFSLFLIVVALAVFSVPIIDLTSQVNQKMDLPQGLQALEDWMRAKENDLGRLTKQFLRMSTWSDFAINMFMIAVLPAVGEELLFRGIIQRILFKAINNIHLAIIIGAILFSALHLQFYGFIPRMFLGMLFGYLFYWSGSIWVPILAHFINNGTVVVFSYLFQKNYVNFNIEENQQIPTGGYVFSILLTGTLLYLFYKHSQSARAIT